MTHTVVVATFRTRAEAELAAASLDGADIPYLIQSAEGMLHGPLAAGAEIRVLPDALDDARDILADLLEESPSGPGRVRRLVPLGRYGDESVLRRAVDSLEEHELPYVIAHPDAASGLWTLFVRREHALPARRAVAHV